MLVIVGYVVRCMSKICTYIHIYAHCMSLPVWSRSHHEVEIVGILRDIE